VTLRHAAVAGASAVVLAGLLLAIGPPRAVWLNAGLRIEYPWPRGTAALAAAAGAAALAALARARALRLLAGALAVAAALAGAGLLTYRLEALDAGLAERRLLGTARLAWADVASVEQEPQALVVSGRGLRLRIDTGRLSPEQRASLERTVARRVRESGQELPNRR